MNQRDALNQARISVFGAAQQATAMHNMLAHAISCTPSGPVRNGLTEANIRLGQIEAILANTTDGIVALLQKTNMPTEEEILGIWKDADLAEPNPKKRFVGHLLQDGAIIRDFQEAVVRNVRAVLDKVLK